MRLPLSLVPVCLFVFVTSVYAQPTPRAAFALDEGTGTVANDSSGNGNTGSLLGPSWVQGKVEFGLSFDGVDDRVGVAHASNLDVTNAVTVSAWFKLASYKDWSVIASKESTTQDHSYAVWLNPQHRLAGNFVIGDNVHQVLSPSAIPLNTWTHVAVTYDGSLMRLYLNGVEVSTKVVSGDFAATTGPLWIGGDQWSSDYFPGVIDEVRVYGDALSESAIRNDMTLPVNPAAPLQLTATSPTPNAIGIRNTAISATFSRPMNAASLSASSVILETLGGTAIASARSYDAASRTVTITPNSALNALAGHRVRVLGGTSGVLGAQAETLAADVAWTFTTAAAGGLSAAWPFEEATGATTLDYSGNGNDGSLLGPAWVAGRFGGGLSFDGVDDRVQVPDADTLDVSTAITISAWIKLSSYKDWSVILSKESPDDHAYALWLGPTHLPTAHFRLGGQWYGALAPEPVPLNTWTHLAATYDGTAIRVYVNGVEEKVTGATGEFPQSWGPLWIGGDQWASDYFPGVIDEVRLYDRALSVAEIQSDMTLPADPTAPVQVTAFTPANNAAGVRYTPISATFGSPMHAQSATLAARLETLAGTAVSTTNAYNASTRTVTLAPTAALSALTTYRLRVIGGAGGATSVSGGTMSSDFTSIFNTAAAGTLAGAWAFSEGAGSITIDSSANGNSGTLLGPSWVSGQNGNALSFDGIDDRVRVEDADTLDIPGPITIAAWVRLSAYKDWSVILSKESRVQDHSYAIWITPQHKLVAHFMLDGYGHSLAAPDVVPLTTWTHVAASYDGSTMRLFINGTEAATLAASGSFENTAGPLWIGGDQWPSDYFPGSIDEVRLYGRALSAGEIQSIASQAITTNAPPPPVASPNGGVYAPLPAVSLSAISSTAIRYTLDGSAPTEASTLYSGPITLPAGGATLKAVAFLGSTASATLVQTYTPDTTAPTIAAVRFPPPLNNWHMTPVTISFLCNDNGTVTSCSAPATLSAEGAGTVVIGTVVDSAGLQASVQETVNIDRTAPAVTLTAPTNLSSTTASSILVTGSVSDALSGLANVMCNGTATPVVEGQVSCNVPLRPGQNAVTISAQDAAGNSMSKGVSVWRVGTVTRLTLTPSDRRMLVNETATLSLVDDFGVPVTGATWTTTNSNRVSLSSDDPPILTALATGVVNITASKPGLTPVVSTIWVVAGAVLPEGEIRWTVPSLPTPNLRRDPPIYANRNAENDPELFIVETNISTWERTVRPVISTGEVPSMIVAPQASRCLVTALAV